MKPPARQSNYQRAFEQAREGARRQNRDNLLALGCREAGPRQYELIVLGARFLVDLEDGVVASLSNKNEKTPPAPVLMRWQILALRYLSARGPWAETADWVSFADLPDGRAYDPVFRARVPGRLCATVGREHKAFVGACERLGGQRLEWKDESFGFQVFPRVAVAIVWHAGDEDLAPAATFLYPSDILCLLSIEDVIVLSESLVSRLEGRCLSVPPLPFPG